jgi:hypothetical protein
LTSAALRICGLDCWDWIIAVHPATATVGSVPLQRKIAELEGPVLALRSGAAGPI